MSKLDLEHSEYTQNYRNWKLVRDIIKGEKALKDADLDKIPGSYGAVNSQLIVNSAYNKKLSCVYLPYTSQTYELSDLERYKTYVQRASLFNATSRTEQGMAGMVYSKPSLIELPESIQYLSINCDGSGVGIVEQSVEVLKDLLEVGRAGLFVDYPNVDRELTLDELASGNIHANIIKYSAEQIKDWSTIQVGAAEKLSYVKLEEHHCERDPTDIFSTLETTTYRVLLLNSDGVYEQRIYYTEDEYTSVIPTDYVNQPFTFIPFFFVGSTDNRPDVDIAPLLELAELNIKHYRNSADYEESCFLVGQPIVGITGLDNTWIKDNFPDGVTFGSRQCMMLPVGGAISIVQASPNTMAMEGMKSKESQMKMLGARLITDGGQVETATAARIRHASDVSVLKVIVKNMTDAYISAILAVQLYNGSVEEFSFKINDDFFADKYSLAELFQLLSLWQEYGVVSEQEFEKAMKEAGIRN